MPAHQVPFLAPHCKWIVICFPEREKQGEAHAPNGFAKDGEHRLAAMQGCMSVASFSRSPQGSNACVRRVTRKVTQGLRAARTAQRNGFMAVWESN
jgi:hypothetical protein